MLLLLSKNNYLVRRTGFAGLLDLAVTPLHFPLAFCLTNVDFIFQETTFCFMEGADVVSCSSQKGGAG
jgi:hypothetical protein